MGTLQAAARGPVRPGRVRPGRIAWLGGRGASYIAPLPPPLSPLPPVPDSASMLMQAAASDCGVQHRGLGSRSRMSRRPLLMRCDGLRCGGAIATHHQTRTTLLSLPCLYPPCVHSPALTPLLPLPCFAFAPLHSRCCLHPGHHPSTAARHYPCHPHYSARYPSPFATSASLRRATIRIAIRVGNGPANGRNVRA